MAAKKASDECWRSFVNHLLWLAFLLVLLYCLLGLFNLKLVEDGYVDSNLNTFSMLFYVSVIVLSIVWVIVNVIINYIMHWKIKTGRAFYNQVSQILLAN